MSRSQLTLAHEVLSEAQNSSQETDFWQRNREFHSSFSQNWADAHERIKSEYGEIDSALKMLPEPRYKVVENRGQNEYAIIVLHTNMAVKALATVKESDNSTIYDTRLYNNSQINMNDLQCSFYKTLD